MLKGRLLTKLLIAAALALGVAAQGQVIAFTGGTSTLLHTSGGQADYAWGDYSGFLGLGTYNGWQAGGLVTTRTHGYQLSGGDVEEKFVVDSDLFDGTSPGFYSRGFQLSHAGEKMSWKAFGGLNSYEQYQGFYKTYSSQDATGAFSYSWKITDRLRFHSNNIAQDKFTSLESLRYNVTEHWVVGAGAGVGRNAPYGSLATDLEGKRYRFTGSYSYLGDGFQRFLVLKSAIPERNRANLRLIVRPLRRWSVTTSHENMVSVEDTSQVVRPKIRLNAIATNGMLFGFQLGASATNSTSGQLWTHTRGGSISHDLFNKFLNIGFIYTQLNDQYGKNKFEMVTAQERLSNRLILREMFVHGNNNPLNSVRTTQNTVTSGVSFRSNRLTLSVDQQFVYDALPTGGNSVYKAWTVNLNVALIRSTRLNVQSFVDQTGRMRYTSFLDGLLLARGNEVLPSATATTPDFGRFFVKGVVQDESGKPVWGICVHVDGQAAYSDSTGQFFVRFHKGETYPVQVLVNESLAPVRYELVSAPVSARAETPDIASPMVIVVRVAKNPPQAPQKKKRSALEGPEETEKSGDM